MKSGKLLVAMGVAFLMLGANAVQAAPSLHAKANSTGETVHALKQNPNGAAKAAAKGRAHSHKRGVQHDATLDYPQLG